MLFSECVVFPFLRARRQGGLLRTIATTASSGGIARSSPQNPKTPKPHGGFLAEVWLCNQIIIKFEIKILHKWKMDSDSQYSEKSHRKKK